jgi:hypothetical protein
LQGGLKPPLQWAAQSAVVCQEKPPSDAD